MFAKTSCESLADKPADASVYNPSAAVPSDIPYCVPKFTISSDYENIGSKLFDYLKKNKIENSYFDVSKIDINLIQLEKIIHGAKLKSYSFNIYKSNNKKNKNLN